VYATPVLALAYTLWLVGWLQRWAADYVTVSMTQSTGCGVLIHNRGKHNCGVCGHGFG